MTANLPMSAFKLTGLGAGSSSGDSIRYEQVNGLVTTAGDILYATGSGTLARLSIGTAGQRLQTNSGATAPEWVSATATQTFLAADVNLNNTANYFNVVNTGSIGASGQVWSIRALATVTDTAGAAALLVRIWDGSSTVYVEIPVLLSSASSTAGIPAYVEAIVTLSGATTIYLSCKDVTSTSGKVLTTGNSGTANKATWIVAQRLQ